ncbi:endonuclease III domain-containing protein [Chloroflexota bacterium]
MFEVKGPSGAFADFALSATLEELYQALLARYGRQHWWPADDPFEVIVGAILTQSTAWTNVEKAISNLKGVGALSPQALRMLSLDELALLIRPSGYYRVKALRLKSFASFLGDGYGDSLEALFSLDVGVLRGELLSVYGIGPETADSIVLYAAEKPVFVIDAYTRRIVSRLGLASGDEAYGRLQALFMANLPCREGLYNEYHALLVRHGKEVCRKTPRCGGCLVAYLCHFGGIGTGSGC